jgi:hypothetical protein
MNTSLTVIVSELEWSLTKGSRTGKTPHAKVSVAKTSQERWLSVRAAKKETESTRNPRQITAEKKYLALLGTLSS